MLTIKNAADIEKMKAAGRLTEDVLKLMAEMAKPGVTTEELDKAAEELIRSRGGFPSCLGYNGYPKTICTSVNEQVVHGIPGKYRLKDGDIVSCDVVAKLDGFHGDATRTLLIGDVPEKTRRLVKVTEECFFEGLKFARVGYRISDISAAIQKHAESNGYGVVRDMIGHGIGREMHESPDVPNYVGGRYGRGIRRHPSGEAKAQIHVAAYPQTEAGAGMVTRKAARPMLVVSPFALTMHCRTTPCYNWFII